MGTTGNVEDEPVLVGKSRVDGDEWRVAVAPVGQCLKQLAILFALFLQYLDLWMGGTCVGQAHAGNKTQAFGLFIKVDQANCIGRFCSQDKGRRGRLCKVFLLGRFKPPGIAMTQAGNAVSGQFWQTDAQITPVFGIGDRPGNARFKPGVAVPWRAGRARAMLRYCRCAAWC